jgi:DHA1 family multidrug resistance protein-like MFS transporter
MKPGVAGLTFFGLIIGCMLAAAVMVLRQPVYQRKLEANKGVQIPEWRLPEAIVGGIAFTGAMFWLGWSGYREEVHWIVPTLSGLVSGFGLLSIFVQALNYLVDAYLMACFPPFALLTLLTLCSVRCIRHRCEYTSSLSFRRRLSIVRNIHV